MGAPDQEPNALAVYGELAPGGRNHWVVRSIPGRWTSGRVRGWQFEITWGDDAGSEGFVVDPDGARVAVAVLIGDSLDRHLGDVDEFEGAGFRRESIAVELDDGGEISAWIWAAVPDHD